MRMGKVIVLLQLSLDKGKKHDKTFSILNLCSRDSDWTRAQPSRKLKLALEGTFYTLAYTFLIELHGI